MINLIFMVLSTSSAHGGGRCPDDLRAEWTPPILEPARRAALRVALRDAATLPNDQPRVFTFSESEEYYARSARVKIRKPNFKYLIGMDRWRIE